MQVGDTQDTLFEGDILVRGDTSSREELLNLLDDPSFLWPRGEVRAAIAENQVNFETFLLPFFLSIVKNYLSCVWDLKVLKQLSQVFYTFDALSEFTAAERGLVVATMRAIEDKTGCVQFRKVESHLKTLMGNFQGGRCRWSCRLGVDHGPTRKRVRAFSLKSQEKLLFHLW